MTISIASCVDVLKKLRERWPEMADCVARMSGRGETVEAIVAKARAVGAKEDLVDLVSGAAKAAKVVRASQLH